MADNLEKDERSRLMSKISGKETKPEILVRKYLFSKGLRYRKNVQQLPGSPDVVLPRFKTVIFVHGCFWHGHEGCRQARLPTSNVEFWQKKRNNNLDRDARKIDDLICLGWHIVVVWECELKNKEKRAATLNSLYEKIVTSK